MAHPHISPYEGSWYPGRQTELHELIEGLFERSCRRTGPYVIPDALAMVVPHAAPCYSGAVAAAAYRHVHAARPNRVFILGFSHSGYRRGIAIPDVETYRTPLGDLAVDRSTVRALCAAAPFRLAEEYEACDHSVEIQLPFLRRAAPNAAVIPVYVGHLEPDERTVAAEVLAKVFRPGDVLLASSDLTHYGRGFHYTPFPVDSQTAARLSALDHSVMDAASSVESELFLESLRESGATACGYQPISLLLRTLSLLAGRDIFQQQLDYQTSGEITGDFHESVSYAALGYFHRRSFELNEAERRELLLSAHATLRRFCETGSRQIVPPRSLPALARVAPVFVSLRDAGRLIGCVGRVFDCQPLAEAVPRMLLAAALEDPRRSPCEPVPEDAGIEITVLTPMKLVRGPDAIRIGRDGAYVSCGAHRALLLPQAARPGWTAAEFVDCLFKKAGLGLDQHDAAARRLYVFRAQVFSTLEEGGKSVEPL